MMSNSIQKKATRPSVAMEEASERNGSEAEDNKDVKTRTMFCVVSTPGP